MSEGGPADVFWGNSRLGMTALNAEVVPEALFASTANPPNPFSQFAACDLRKRLCIKNNESLYALLMPWIQQPLLETDIEAGSKQASKLSSSFGSRVSDCCKFDAFHLPSLGLPQVHRGIESDGS